MGSGEESAALIPETASMASLSTPAYRQEHRDHRSVTFNPRRSHEPMEAQTIILRVHAYKRDRLGWTAFDVQPF